MTVPPAPEPGAGTGEPSGAPETVSLYEKWRKIYPLWVSGGFQTWRRVVLVVLLLVFYVSPWLQWKGQPGVHFDLMERRFTLFWSTFVPEEFILLAWLLLIAALVLFTVTVAAGRLFCGWACPQTVWSLVYFTIEVFVEGDRNSRLRLDKGAWNRKRIGKKALKYALWAGVAFSISVTFVGYFVPIRELLPRILAFELGGWEQFALLFPAAGSFLMSGVLREQVCFHMCPYARFQSVMFDRDSLIISYDAERGEARGKRRRNVALEESGLGACIDCKKCVNVCPTGIDIRDGLQYQCIGCAACVDACHDVMQTMGYGESLVRYSSENLDQHKASHLIRPRLIGYSSIILVVLGLFSYTLTHRVPIGLDIVRDRNRLYREHWDGSVENVYTLRIANRANDAREYEIDYESALPLSYEGRRVVRVEGGELEPVAIRLRLPEHGAAEIDDREVRFRVRQVSAPEVGVDKESLFHLPHPEVAR